MSAISVMISQIQDALGTAETGNALIEVARNAHRAEMELAGLQLRLNQCDTNVAEVVKEYLKDMNNV